MLDAGTIIIIVAATNFSEDDIRIIEEIVNFKAVEIISVKALNESFTIVEKVLMDKGIIIKNK